MADQMQLFDTSEKQSSNSTGKAKRKWQMVSRDGATGTVQMVVTLLGAVDGRPCVRSLNAMIREKRLKIDYEKTGYVEAWEGILNNG